MNTMSLVIFIATLSLAVVGLQTLA